ncbi:MAG: GTP 3',8-cyclase MoaA [Gammaproteobacteria bacterium]|nr:GTP 3',8-cyclase MoaA [Gammaproteobacteria bacterium]
MPHPPQLTDQFGRRITYLRISVTDRCDLRCVYCMAADVQFVPHRSLLTLEEISRIGRAFVSLGVKKIRITGGEPLTRKNVAELFRQLGRLESLGELTLTTNGTQLPRFAETLYGAGVRRVNISIDSLHATRFRDITRTGTLQRTLDGIDAALAAGLKVKLNAVVLKNRNHDEVTDLATFALARDMDISFIEEMPLGLIDEHDRAEAYYSSNQVLADLRQSYPLLPTTESSGGPSRYFRIPGRASRIGFISPHSHNFCDQCNRVRLTAEGRLLLCLGQEHSVDLRRVVRANPTSDDVLQQAIVEAMKIKPRGHEFDLSTKPVIFRHMNATGG